MRMRISPMALAAVVAALTITGCRKTATEAAPAAREPAPTTEAAGPRLEPGGAPLALAFSHKGDVYLAEAGDSVPRRLTQFGNCHLPAWSRDGAQLAFVRDREDLLDTGAGEERAGEVWVCKADGSEARKVAESTRGGLGPGISGLAWTHDDLGIVVMAGLAATSGGLWRVYLTGAVSGGKQGANTLQGVGFEASGLAISEHNYARGYGAEEVFLVNSDLQKTAYATELTDLFPVFSPDCEAAALVSPDNPGAGEVDQTDCIYVVPKPAFADADWLEKNAKGDAAEGTVADPNGLPTRAVRIYQSAAGLAPSELAWSADGSWLAFMLRSVSDDANAPAPEVWALNTRTKELRKLITDGAEPAWQPPPPSGPRGPQQ